MIFAFLFLALLAGLLYRLRLSQIKTRLALREFFVPVLVLSLLFFVVSFFALLEWAGRLAFTTLPLTTSLERLKDNKGNVIVEAKLSSANSARYRDYVAYIRSARTGDEAVWRDTPPLVLELATGAISVENDNYTLRNWRGEQDAFYLYQFLRAGDTVVVVGTVSRGQALTGAVAGQTVYALQAREVFLGTHAEYLNVTQQTTWLPNLISASALFGSFVTGLALPIALAAIWRTTR